MRAAHVTLALLEPMLLLGLQRLRIGVGQARSFSPLRVPFRTAVSRAAKKVSGEPPQSPQERVVSRFPKFMTRYADRVLKAPVSHITAFLIVHELSAIVPLFGIWGAFHYMDYTPIGVMPDWVVQKGASFIRGMAERNNWQMLATAERGSAVILQGAAAYGLVKVLLPLRLAFSLWTMPWFARWCVIPVTTRFSSVLRKLRKRP